MERKRIEKLVILLIIGILMPVSLFPFPIHADTINTDNIVGVSAVVSDSLVNGQVTYNSQTFNTYYVNYDVEIIFDQAYLGYVQLTLEYDYYNRDSSGIVNRTNNQTRRVFVNGSSAHINLNILSAYSNAPLQVTYNNPRVSTITTGGTNVTPIGDLADIQQIIEILQDIYSLEGDLEGLSNNQLLQLQQVVSNTSLANEYLDTLTKAREFEVYNESIPWVIYLLKNHYNRLDTINTNNYYLNYPVFNMVSNNYLWFNTDLGSAGNQYIHFIFISSTWIPQNNASSLFTNQNLQLKRYDRKNFSKPYFIYHFVYNSLVASNEFVLNQNIGSFMPLYIGINNNPNDDTFSVSTDFAIQFGLSNRLLNDLDIIANGTSQSSSASESLDQTTSQFSDDANDLVTIEESFNNSMNQSLQNVNPTFNMGSSFLASANWVSTQFNRIVNNTPFASLITFGLTLGLGLLIIGKVRK